MKKMNASNITVIFAVMCIMGVLLLIMPLKIFWYGGIALFIVGVVTYQVNGGPQAFRKYNKKLRW